MRDVSFGYPPSILGPQNGAQGVPEAYPDTPWDFALIAAFQTIDSYTDEYGLHAWEVADEAVEVQAIRKTNKFLASKEITTGKKGYRPLPGEYFIPRVQTRRDDGHFWTFNEWLEYETGKIEEDNPTE